MSEELVRSGEALFKVGRRGYDRDEVDAYVRSCSVRSASSGPQQTPDAAVRSALERVGDEVADMLKQAHDTADEIIASASARPTIIARRRQRHAAHVTAVAEQRVHELDLDTDRIWGERERMVADARDLARQLNQLRTAAERFPHDRLCGRGGAADRNLDYGPGERMSGFEELNASN